MIVSAFKSLALSIRSCDLSQLGQHVRVALCVDLKRLKLQIAWKDITDASVLLRLKCKVSSAAVSDNSLGEPMRLLASTRG